RAEFTGGDLCMACARQLDQGAKQRLGELWLGCVAEASTRPLVRIRGQSELRHQQQAAAGVGERQVHASGFVLEYPVTEHAFEQTFGMCRLVVALHADERE